MVTMYKVYTFVFIVSCVAIVQITGQDCRPSLLWEVDLDVNYILSWNVPSTEVCEISYWIVYMKHNENDTEHVHTATEKSLDISFLPKCESMRFRIVSVSSDGVEGDGIVFHKILPLPKDANLAITTLRIVPQGNAALLQWDLEEEWINCAKHYRVLTYDVDTDYPRDIYVSTNSATITDLTPCGSYEFAITPMYNVETPGQGTLTRYSVPHVEQSAPALQSINVGSTTVDLTWHLQTTTANRCAVSALTVDASPYFSATYPVLDQSNRPPVTTHLTNLQSDTMYILNVTVVNSAGPSAPFLVAVQTLESD